MCLAKIDGGRRCEHDLRFRMGILKESLEELNSEIDEIQGAMLDPSLDSSERERARVYLNTVLNRIRIRENRIAKYERQLKLTPTAMSELHEQIHLETDPKAKEELLAEQTRRMEGIEKRRAEQQEAFMRQRALRQVFSELGIPKEKQDEVIHLITRDNKTSQLRSAESYKAREKQMTEEITYLKTVWAEEEKDKAYEKGSTPEECDALAGNVDVELARKVSAVQKRLAKVKADYRCTNEGLSSLMDTVAQNYDARWNESQALFRAGDRDGALAKQEQMLAAYERGIDLIQISRERRNARMTDRNIRDTTRRLVKKHVTDAGGSQDDFKRAMSAIKKPEAVELKESSGLQPVESKEPIFVLLTDSEAQKFEDRNTLSELICRQPKLPQGKTLNDIHDDFVRHSTGKGHRQSTVQSERRTKKMTIYLEPREALRLRARASALNTTVSSFARQMALYGNPFSLQADRSRNTERKQRVAMREQIDSLLAT